MNIFKKLKDSIENKINLAYAPNVEYVFECSLLENTKPALIEISEYFISKLKLDATVIKKIVFIHDDSDSRFGYYTHTSETVVINCAKNTQAYMVIETIAHELFHAFQLSTTWGFSVDYNETNAEDFEEQYTDELMSVYWERLEEDFPTPTL